jgi:hypothetical protein
MHFFSSSLFLLLSIGFTTLRQLHPFSPILPIVFIFAIDFPLFWSIFLRCFSNYSNNWSSSSHSPYFHFHYLFILPSEMYIQTISTVFPQSILEEIFSCLLPLLYSYSLLCLFWSFPQLFWVTQFLLLSIYFGFSL